MVTQRKAGEFVVRQVSPLHNIVICAASDVLNLNCRMRLVGVAVGRNIGLCVLTAGCCWLRPCCCRELDVCIDVSGNLGAELSQSALLPAPRANHAAEC